MYVTVLSVLDASEINMANVTCAFAQIDPILNGSRPNWGTHTTDTESVQSTNPLHMKQTPMRNLSGLIIATFCLMGMPVHAQAANQGSTAIAPAPKAGHIFRDCPDCPEMVVIPSGSFDMGSPGSEAGRGDDEGPVHSVKIAAFALGRTEITRGQFAEFVKSSGYIAGDKCWTLENGKYEERNGRNWREPGYPQDDNHPVACINWNDALAYAEWMSQQDRKKIPSADGG